MEPISTSSASPAQVEPTSQTPTQRLLASLRSSFTTIEELEDVLLQVLAAVDAIPLSFEVRHVMRTELGSNDVLHILPTIQHLILCDILPTWLSLLREVGHEHLARAFFCPSSARTGRTPNVPKAIHSIEVHCNIATSSLPILLLKLHALNPKDPGPASLLAFSVSVLGDVVSWYPVDVVYDALFPSNIGADSRTYACRTQEWEDHVRAACSVPGKVANALQGQKDIFSDEKLDYG